MAEWPANRNRREMRNPAGDRSFEPGGSRGGVDGARQAVTDADGHVRPARPFPWAPFAKGGMAATREASPLQGADPLAGDAFRQTELGRCNGDIDLTFRDLQ